VHPVSLAFFSTTPKLAVDMVQSWLTGALGEDGIHVDMNHLKKGEVK
jgi:hypothetical protein